MHPVVVSVPTPWGALPLYAYGLALGAGLVVAWYVAHAGAARLAGRAVAHAGAARLAGRAATTSPDAPAPQAASPRAPSPHPHDEVALPFLAAALGGALAGLVFGAFVHPRPGGAPFAVHGEALSGPFALAGALVFGALAARRQGSDGARLGALAAPCLGVIYAADALGHYLHGTGFGRLLGPGAPGFLRALGTFPRWELEGGRLGAPAYVHHLVAYPERMVGRAAESLAVHPVQLYDAAIGVVVAVIAFRALARGSERARRLVLPATAAALALGHLAVDGARFLPGGAPRSLLSGAQWTVVGVVVAGIVGAARAARGRAHPTPGRAG